MSNRLIKIGKMPVKGLDKKDKRGGANRRAKKSGYGERADVLRKVTGATVVSRAV